MCSTDPRRTCSLHESAAQQTSIEGEDGEHSGTVNGRGDVHHALRCALVFLPIYIYISCALLVLLSGTVEVRRLQTKGTSERVKIIYLGPTHVISGSIWVKAFTLELSFQYKTGSGRVTLDPPRNEFLTRIRPATLRLRHHIESGSIQKGVQGLRGDVPTSRCIDT